MKLLAFNSLFIFSILTTAMAEEPIAYEDDKISASPKAPWGEFEVVEEHEPTVLTKVLLWLPNRVLDFIDIFRVDIGAGFGTGAVVRVTKYGQAGIRLQTPGMLRAGIFGRKLPIQMEVQSEIGAGPLFEESDTRDICTGITGAGVDLVLVGIHLGFCPEEIVDFFAGIATYDIQDDDL